MAKLTALIAAAALATAASSPAFACSWGKTAKSKTDVMAETHTLETTDEAMTTFDPADKPAFEDAAKAADVESDAELKIEE